MIFNDPEVNIWLTMISYLEYTLTIKSTSSVQFYMLHPDNKKPHPVTFYTVSNEGSMLLSCTVLLPLDLIQTRPHLDYLSPKTKLITSAADYPDITRHTAHQAKFSVKQKEPQSKPMKIVTKLISKNTIKIYLKGSDVSQANHITSNSIQKCLLSKYQ